MVLDRYGIHKKNKLRSPVSQFAGFPNGDSDDWVTNIWNAAQTVPDIQFAEAEPQVGLPRSTFSFISRIQNNGDANRMCRGEYVPSTQESKTDVVIIHGWKSSSLKSVKKMLLNSLHAEGYNLYIMELPHHMSRKLPESGFSGEYMISADIGRTILSVHQAVQDAADLVAWSKAQGHKAFVVGTSLGGMVTNLLGCTGTPMDALISVMYATDTAHLVWNSDIAKYIKKDLVEAGVRYEQLEQAWRTINPALFKLTVRKQDVLLISGEHDLFITKEDSAGLWEAWGKPLRKVVSCGHGGLSVCTKRLSDIIVRFLREHK
jgi:pimeloyl-ACP methyl ester carboxylesterase